MSFHRKPPAGNVRRVQPISGNLRGVITNKTGRVVQFESFGERSLLLRLERDRSVTDYGSQPETFAYVGDAGKACHYTPDFIVWRNTGATEIHEVTLSARRTKTNAVGREQAAQAICRERGWQYVVHTEQELPRDTELVNLLRLYPFRVKAYANPLVEGYVGNWLMLKTPMPLSELVGRLTEITHLGQPCVWGTLFYEIWQGDLSIDWQRPFFDGALPATDVQVWRERQGSLT